jgi:RNA polymerase sigma-70 factor (ECF subfamily)
MSDTNDIAVLDRILRGDVEAFGEIVERYQDRIIRYVYSQFGNYDEALDITQEIFIMALESIASFRRESKFSTWLFSIMINYCKNHRKRRSRYQTVPISRKEEGIETDIQIADKREDPEGKIVLEDSMRIVKDEIEKLPEDYREVIVLRDIDGMSYTEIADLLNINLSNVKVRIHRGREHLKKQLVARGLI